MTIAPPLYREIVDFWRDAGPKLWFAKSDAFDAAIRDRFAIVQQAAARGELPDWIDAPDSALALVLLLDQFPRNLYRGSAAAFASDPLARDTATRAIALGHDLSTEIELRPFFYLPFVHAEDLAAQNRGVDLMAGVNAPDSLRYAELHREIIRRFGRFPHRNAALGRLSTPEEIAYLAGPGFKG
jgi:uncharacterized protein (DUF924 family)